MPQPATSPSVQLIGHGAVNFASIFYPSTSNPSTDPSALPARGACNATSPGGLHGYCPIPGHTHPFLTMSLLRPGPPVHSQHCSGGGGGGASHREVRSPHTSLQAQATFVCARAPKSLMWPLFYFLLLSPVLRLASSSLLFHRRLTPDAAPHTSFQHICIALLSRSVCHPLGEAHPHTLPANKPSSSTLNQLLFYHLK